VVDLIFPEKTRTFPKETLGVVPIGIPLIVGPAVLTLLLMVVHTYGFVSAGTFQPFSALSLIY
jgi:multiple antibiotic resistance protein